MGSRWAGDLTHDELKAHRVFGMSANDDSIAKIRWDLRDVGELDGTNLK